MNINDIITESQEKCPHCGGPLVEYSNLMEKKDACYYKVKASAKVWPSAYASGRLVQCRKKGAANYGNKSESVAEAQLDEKCWDGYQQQGMKNKGGRQVPNCVPSESVTEGADPGILFYAKDPAAQQKIYARVKDAEHLALLQQRYRGAEIKTFDYRRPDVIKWLEARGINLRKFVPGMIQTMPDVSDGLNEFARNDDDREEGPGDDPYRYPKPKQYSRSVDYFGQFEADHFDREDFDDATGIFKGYRGDTPIAYFKFADPAQTGDDDPGQGWYYEPESGGSDNTTAAPAADRSNERKQQELDMIRQFLKSGNRPGPDSQIGRLMKKHGMMENYRDRRDAYQRDQDNAEYGMNKRQSRVYQQDGGANDESNELDPSEWYFIKDGKMFKIMIYPNQEQEAITRGYSRTREGAKAKASEQGLNEFAMGGSDDDGSDGFSDDTLRQLAAQWYNGDEDPRVESTLMAAGWEIGQDEGYDDTPGVFVVQAGDINGNSYISWPAHELEGLAETVDPEIEEMYQAMEQLAEEMAARKGVSVDLVWESFEALDDHMLYETAAWRRKEGKSAKGGLNAKGVASYRRENPGSKLQMAVTTKPSKLKKGSKAAKRRKSFCARMSGVKGPMKKPNGKPTRKALALRKWNC